MRVLNFAVFPQLPETSDIRSGRPKEWVRIYDLLGLDNNACWLNLYRYTGQTETPNMRHFIVSEFIDNTFRVVIFLICHFKILKGEMACLSVCGYNLVNLMIK